MNWSIRFSAHLKNNLQFLSQKTGKQQYPYFIINKWKLSNKSSLTASISPSYSFWTLTMNFISYLRKWRTKVKLSINIKTKPRTKHVRPFDKQQQGRKNERNAARHVNKLSFQLTDSEIILETYRSLDQLPTLYNPMRNQKHLQMQDLRPVSTKLINIYFTIKGRLGIIFPKYKSC